MRKYSNFKIEDLSATGIVFIIFCVLSFVLGVFFYKQTITERYAKIKKVNKNTVQIEWGEYNCVRATGNYYTVCDSKEGVIKK